MRRNVELWETADNVLAILAKIIVVCFSPSLRMATSIMTLTSHICFVMKEKERATRVPLCRVSVSVCALCIQKLSEPRALLVATFAWAGTRAHTLDCEHAHTQTEREKKIQKDKI